MWDLFLIQNTRFYKAKSHSCHENLTSMLWKTLAGTKVGKQIVCKARLSVKIIYVAFGVILNRSNLKPSGSL